MEKINFNKITSALKAMQEIEEEQKKPDAIEESTNWKGSKSVALSRYSAKKGFGVQLSQIKPMAGERIPVTGVHIKMPLEEIPQLIKGLQNVYKAKAGVQLGDDD